VIVSLLPAATRPAASPPHVDDTNDEGRNEEERKGKAQNEPSIVMLRNNGLRVFRVSVLVFGCKGPNFDSIRSASLEGSITVNCFGSAGGFQWTTSIRTNFKVFNLSILKGIIWLNHLNYKKEWSINVTHQQVHFASIR